MERIYTADSQKTTIYYGETFAAFLKKHQLNNEHFIIISNQFYYDRYAEKLSYLLSDQIEQDWFITPNHRFCNNLEEFIDLVAFSSHFNEDKDYVIIAFGNEGVVELAAFFAQVTYLKNRLWILSVSLASLTKGIVLEKQIVQLPQNKKVLSVDKTAEYMIVDDTLHTTNYSIAMMDLFLMIRCGIVCDYDFLKTLFKNYQKADDLREHSFSGLLDNVLVNYQKAGSIIDEYGGLFEQAFYQTPNGHLLSADLKTFFGFLFALIWNIQKNNIDFHLENFMKWLAYLGFPLQLPEQLFIGEYGTALLETATNKRHLILDKIGVPGESRILEENDLNEAFKLYHDIIQRMRGN